jgi:hypothetical protein
MSPTVHLVGVQVFARRSHALVGGGTPDKVAELAAILPVPASRSVEAAGTADAQNAPAAPWKITEQVFHSYHRVRLVVTKREKNGTRLARPAGLEPATLGLEGCVPVTEDVGFQQVARTATRTCHALDLPRVSPRMTQNLVSNSGLPGVSFRRGPRGNRSSGWVAD